MNDGIVSNIHFYGTLEYTVFDENGNVKDTGVIHNQIQNLLMDRIIDGLDAGTISVVSAMAIGTGINASVVSAHLISKVSQENITTQDQPTTTSLRNIATFRSVTGTVTEAGLFDMLGAVDDMYCYNDGLNVPLTATDSLQLAWTISVTSA